MALDRELQTYQKLKDTLLQNHEGKFALIKGDELIGVFDSTENAYEHAVKLLVASPF
jgi:hypothetical protein